jgi:hypothetical protein
MISNFATLDQSNIFKKYLAVINKSVGCLISISLSQNIAFLSLIMNYLADFNIMSKGIYDNSLLLFA